MGWHHIGDSDTSQKLAHRIAQGLAKAYWRARKVPPIPQAVLLSGSSPRGAARKPGFAALIPALRYTRDRELLHNKHGALNAARTGERNDLRDIALDQRAKLVVDLKKSGGVDR